MMVEHWDRTTSGVLLAEPLLLRANRAGAFGDGVEYPGGSVRKALFTYLCGAPDAALLRDRPELFREAWLVCMSAEWEELIRALPHEPPMRRVMMRPRCGASRKPLAPLPEGYAIREFGPELFAAHPFGQGANYRDFDDFSRNGAGAVALCGGKVVAAASSFLTVGNEIELDMCTDPAHRRQGLADHCIARMLRDCAARGLTVHWDAQNAPSAAMARGHGFVEEQEYAVYVLKQA